jgi:hypothetical protein
MDTRSPDGRRLLLAGLICLTFTGCVGDLREVTDSSRPGPDGVYDPDSPYSTFDPTNAYNPSNPLSRMFPGSRGPAPEPDDFGLVPDLPDESDMAPGEELCLPFEEFYETDLWAGVMVPQCAGCHASQGFGAEHSDFVLELAHSGSDYQERNLSTLIDLAERRVGGLDEPYLLLKATNTIVHGGGEVLSEGSFGLQALREFVARLEGDDPCTGEAVSRPAQRDFFEGVAYYDNLELLSKLTMTLASRVPSRQEIDDVTARGMDGVLQTLERVMSEKGFYVRLIEGFNDVFLTDYFYGGLHKPDNWLSGAAYPNRRWFENLGLSHAEQEAIGAKARYGMARDPLELIAHVVRNDRPFTEILTADYIMVNPFSARSYGVENLVRFTNSNDEHEFRPVSLPALAQQGMQGGRFVHAGILTSYMMLGRYPTTETNLNRHRSATFYDKILGVNIQELAARASDPTAVADIDNPTLNAADCAVCHVVMDPVAQLYTYYNDTGFYVRPQRDIYGPTFPPGFNGEVIAQGQIWEGLRWLGQRAARDPRFAKQMVRHAYYIVVGQWALEQPKDPTAIDYRARLQAYRVQDAYLDQVATHFIDSGYNFKTIVHHLVQSPYFRARDIDPATMTPRREVELEGFGAPRLLSPEALQRRIVAVFGKPWMWGTHEAMAGHLYRYLYGGINSDDIVKRLEQPNGVMGAVMAIMGNELACQNVPDDFTRESARRLLFPHVELRDLPGRDQATDDRIRRNIQHLHARIMGEHLSSNHPEIERTFALFKEIVDDGRRGVAAGHPDYPSDINRNCRAGTLSADRDFTIRGWMGVVTYLTTTMEFLYL